MLQQELEILRLEFVEDLKVSAQALAQMLCEVDVGVVPCLFQYELDEFRVESPIPGQYILSFLLSNLPIQPDILLLPHNRIVLPPQLIGKRPIELPRINQLLILILLMTLRMKILRKGRRHILRPLQRPIQVLLRLHKQPPIFYFLIFAWFVMMVGLGWSGLFPCVDIGAIDGLEGFLDVVGVDDGFGDLSGFHEVFERGKCVVVIEGQAGLH